MTCTRCHDTGCVPSQYFQTPDSCSCIMGTEMCATCGSVRAQHHSFARKCSTFTQKTQVSQVNTGETQVGCEVRLGQKVAGILLLTNRSFYKTFDWYSLTDEQQESVRAFLKEHYKIEVSIPPPLSQVGFPKEQ